MAGEWIENKARGIYAGIFHGEWTDKGNGVLQGRCPAAHCHTHQSGKGDARIHLSYGPRGERPGCYCLHQSCKGDLDALNEKFRDAIFARDEKWDGDRKAAAAGESGVVRQAPRDREEWIPEFSVGKLKHVTDSVPPVDWDWFRRRSALEVAGMGPGDFLEAVFRPGDRVLVFTEFRSQGDFLWEVGRGGFRLGEKKGVRAVRSELPRDGKKDGAWYLCQPVDGQWHANPRRDGVLSRRSEEAVAAWRHVVLECDEEKTFRKKGHALLDAAAAVRAGQSEGKVMEALEMGGGKRWAARTYEEGGDFKEKGEWHLAWAPEIPKMWMKLLAYLPLAIRAIYSSGGVSLHALVDVDQKSKPEFDALLREKIKRVWPAVGADPGALTPVRLTRLPGVTRGGRMQELIYVNPRADMATATGILNIHPKR